MSWQLFRLKIILVFICSGLFLSCQNIQEDTYMDLIKKGEFSKATEIITRILETDQNLTEQQKIDLSFEMERMKRIKKDFTLSGEEVSSYIKKYLPDATQEDMARWEQEKSLESMIIDGNKLYFNKAGRNLFRINRECNRAWEDYHKQRNIKT
jgi:hypothetical protein